MGSRVMGLDKYRLLVVLFVVVGGAGVLGVEEEEGRSAWDFPAGRDAMEDLAMADIVGALSSGDRDVAEKVDGDQENQERDKRFFLTPQQTLRTIFRHTPAKLPSRPPARPLKKPIRINALLAAQPAFSGPRRARLASYARLT